jgi:hypothetical protein
MTTEILLLAVACGITMLAFMIAINAHGPFRISFSYFLATVMLSGTVWLITRYVNQDLEIKRSIELTRMEEKRKAEEEAYRKDAEKLVMQNKALSSYTSKLILLIANAVNLTNQILAVDLQNKSEDYETLSGRAAETKRKVDELSAQYNKMDSVKAYLPEQHALVKDAFKSLSEAVYNYKNYYVSEDSIQEAQREKLLRLRAKDALDKFNKAGSMLGK